MFHINYPSKVEIVMVISLINCGTREVRITTVTATASLLIYGKSLKYELKFKISNILVITIIIDWDFEK